MGTLSAPGSGDLCKINSNAPANARKLLSSSAAQSKERQVLCKERHGPKHSPTLQQKCSGSFSKEMCRDLDVSTCGMREGIQKSSPTDMGWSHTREQLRRRNTSAVEVPLVVQQSWPISYFKGTQEPSESRPQPRSSATAAAGAAAGAGVPAGCAASRDAGAKEGAGLPP